MKDELSKLEDIINSKMEEIPPLDKKDSYSDNTFFYINYALKSALEWVIRRIKEIQIYG